MHPFLPPGGPTILQAEMVLIGRAMPVLSREVFAEKAEGSANKLSAKPLGLMLKALDELRVNEAFASTKHLDEFQPRHAIATDIH